MYWILLKEGRDAHYAKNEVPELLWSMEDSMEYECQMS